MYLSGGTGLKFQALTVGCNLFINRAAHRRHSGWDAGIQWPEPAPAKAGGEQASGFPLEPALDLIKGGNDKLRKSC